MMETMARRQRGVTALLSTAGFAAAIATATPLQATTLFGLTDTGELFASADGGVNWTASSTVPVSDAQAIAAGESSDELFLASRSGVVYRSPDAGASWTAVGTVAASDVVDMAIRNSGAVYLLTATGTVWLSTDDGATFTAIATLAASNHVSMTGSSSAGEVYALTRTGEVAQSTDLGASWSVVGTLTTSEAVEIRTLGQDLYVMTGAGIVWQSSDSGTTWLPVGTVSQVHMMGLTTHEDGLVAVSREGLVASSSDATSWDFVGSINQLNVVAIGNDTPTITAVHDATSRPAFRVRRVWPNPAGRGDAQVTVGFDLHEAAQLTVRMYNARGRLVAVEHAGTFGGPGAHEFPLESGGLPTGVYFMHLETNRGTTTQAKLAILR